MLNDRDDFSTSVMDVSPYLGPTEIGEDDTLTPWDVFALEPVRIGDGDFVGNTEIGNVEIGNTEIGDTDIEIGNTEIGAVRQVIKKARDNRQPPPKMRAVAVDEPEAEHLLDWGLTDVFVGVAEATGSPNPFPLTSELMLRFGADSEPRYVRVDTEASYRAFRGRSSPELSEVRERIDALSARLAEHEEDPHAHQELLEEVNDLTALGMAAGQAESAKRIDLWLPRRFEGLVQAWQEGEMVCASLKLPGADGEVRICTSLEPVQKCIAEMARHASEANVPATSVLGILPAMGVVLGAGTVIKSVAAAAPAILRRPEASGRKPFIVRIEPKANPALCALAALAQQCQSGNDRACEEWKRLRNLASGSPVSQAMDEAVRLIKEAGGWAG